VERPLALMAGAGVLPGRAAAEARRQGWRVVAFAFDDAPGLAESAERVIPSRLTGIQSTLDELAGVRPSAALFVGKFWKQEAFAQATAPQAAWQRAMDGGLADSGIADTILATFGAMDIEVLDQRPFLARWMVTQGSLTARCPSEGEWAELRAGFRLAKELAGYAIGQTVVRSRGVTVAVEAVEGTDATIRRGSRLAGPGAVVVKAVAAAHDYRFDMPTIGAGTLLAMEEGGATALAVERGKVLLVDGDEVAAVARRAAIAIVSVGDDG